MLLWSRPSTLLTLGCARFRGVKACLITAVFLASACSKQAEGERCDLLSGSEDCDQGLVCTALEDLRPGAEGAVCCPTGNPTENICRSNTFDFKDDAGTSAPAPVTDGGTAGGSIGSSDSGGATSISESRADASVDATGDAVGSETLSTRTPGEGESSQGLSSPAPTSSVPTQPTLETGATETSGGLDAGDDAATPDAGL